MIKLGFKKGTKISMKERNDLAEVCGKKNPKTVYYLLDRLYEKNFVEKGKEGTGKGSPYFFALRSDPGQIIAPQIMGEDSLGNDLFHSMAKEGYSFLKGQGLDENTLKKICAAWGREISEKKKSSNQLPFGDQRDRLGIKSVYSKWFSRIDERSSDPGDPLFGKNNPRMDERISQSDGSGKAKAVYGKTGNCENGYHSECGGKKCACDCHQNNDSIKEDSICCVCGRPGAVAYSRPTGVVYVHPECEGNWKGKL